MLPVEARPCGLLGNLHTALGRWTTPLRGGVAWAEPLGQTTPLWVGGCVHLAGASPSARPSTHCAPGQLSPQD